MSTLPTLCNYGKTWENQLGSGLEGGHPSAHRSTAQNVFNFMFFFFRKFGIIIYVGFPTGGLALLPNRNPDSAPRLDNNLKASHR